MMFDWTSTGKAMRLSEVVAMVVLVKSVFETILWEVEEEWKKNVRMFGCLTRWKKYCQKTRLQAHLAALPGFPGIRARNGVVVVRRCSWM